jgi:hypothetical protein
VRADVDGEDLRRAAPLALEREKAVVGADVEAALAANVWPRQTVDHAAKVEPAGRDDSGRQLHRVVPQGMPRDEPLGGPLVDGARRGLGDRLVRGHGG